jgi:succinate dehydrogenase hydrophobic anchor subunit
MRAMARDPQLAAFVLIRVTAVLLAVLVLGHFAVTHIVTDVAETDSGFVAKRWSQALWIAWDSTMLVAALTHAGSGLWLLIEQRVVTRRTRRRMQAGTALAIGALASVGIAALTASVIRS